MKTLLTAITLCLSFQFANAENGASLKQNMKQAGALFKAIGTSIKDPAKNPENAKSVEQMAEFFQLTYAQIPDAVQKIPEAQRAQALAGYQKLIQDELELCKELHAAFLANNSDLATQIYQKMKDLKEEGHDKYNP